jgi:hypothetical protein
VVEHRERDAGAEGQDTAETWLEDPTPLTTVPTADLRLLMLEDDGRTRKSTTKGVAWQARQYVAAWMTGQAGREVTARWPAGPRRLRMAARFPARRPADWPVP